MIAKNTDANKIFEAYNQKRNILEEQEAVRPPIKFQSERGQQAVQGLKNFGRGVVNAFTGPSYDQRVAQKDAEKAAQVAQGGSTSADQSTTNPPVATRGGLESSKEDDTTTTNPPVATRGGLESSKEQTNTSWDLTSAPDMGIDPMRRAEAVPPGTAAQTGLGSVAQTSAERGQGAPAGQASQVASVQPSAADVSQYGQTGAELRQSSGGQFVTRADRMDQSKVDAILGQGKYKAGTAEANLALANYFKNNPATITPGRPGQPAGSTNFAQQAQQLGLSPETQQDLAGSQQASAPVSKVNTNTPEYKKWYDEGRQKGYVA